MKALIDTINIRAGSAATALLIGLTLILVFSTFALALEFPYRKDYPDLATIDSETLYAQYEASQIIIVDVRSVIEYDVIHPVGAIHIPLASKDFVKRVKALHMKNPNKKIAFYCNGVTCLKSYKAAQKAQEAGIKNCYAYDSGIPIWASVYPGKTLLVGKVLVDPEKQLIPKSKFKQRCLPYRKFKSQAKSRKAMVVDVRDHIQRSEKLPGLEKVMFIPMNKFIPNFVERKVNRDNTLLIFDQVGKQVQWLEYYLVENGYKDYYFLSGGATAVLGEQKYKK